MANQEHLDILKQGVEVWNKWRKEHSEIEPDLRDANFAMSNLRGVDLSNARLDRIYFRQANLNEANLIKSTVDSADLMLAKLAGANLRGATFDNAKLNGADLSESNLKETELYGVDLGGANLQRANLDETNLQWADVSEADFSEAVLKKCLIYGISTWKVRLEGAIQSDLIITDNNEPKITVDNIEVSQFIYLLLNNQKIRQIIDTITSKVVLILGRFTDERKLVLDALRDGLRNYNFSPVVFDFDSSAKRDLTETISLLAHMSRFVIADLTDAKSIPQELERIVPHLPSVPVQPILQRGTTEYAMFEHYERYPWVLPIYRYQDIHSLLESIKEHIIMPVELKEQEKDKMKMLEEKIKMLEEENKRL